MAGNLPMTTTATSLTIRISGHSYRLPGLAALFSGGFKIAASLPCPLPDLLVEQVGVPKDYLKNRVQTLFLNGDPVDDVENTAVDEGDALALSAAMPGLVGATMRKQGPLASMRRRIWSSGAAPVDITDRQGYITVKLFNMVAGELGPVFLTRGVIIPAHTLLKFIDTAGKLLERRVRRVEVNQKPLTLADLPASLSHIKVLRFTLLAAPVPVTP